MRREPHREPDGAVIDHTGIVPVGTVCGRLFRFEANDCNSGVGDPYIEVAWSRFFGHFRPSAYSGVLPVQEGLSVALGIGAVLPLGQFDSAGPTRQARSIGTNVVDIAPSIALTYTTPPLIADGTEISGKLYWNEYLENRETDYSTGSVMSLDFAVSERIGRAQIGLAGSYLIQLQDDRRSGIPVLPAGNRAEALTLGGVLGFDFPEHDAALKLKFQRSIHAENAVKFWGLSLGLVRRF